MKKILFLMTMIFMFAQASVAIADQTAGAGTLCNEDPASLKNSNNTGNEDTCKGTIDTDGNCVEGTKSTGGIQEG